MTEKAFHSFGFCYPLGKWAYEGLMANIKRNYGHLTKEEVKDYAYNAYIMIKHWHHRDHSYRVDAVTAINTLLDNAYNRAYGPKDDARKDDGNSSWIIYMPEYERIINDHGKGLSVDQLMNKYGKTEIAIRGVIAQDIHDRDRQLEETGF